MKRPGKEKNPEEHAQTEDIVFKAAGEYFGEEALRFLKIPQKMKRVLPTEKIHLEARRMYEDFNMEMENGEIYHFEFESDPIRKRDLRRFRQYEAVTGCILEKDVVTCVVCTADVKVILSRLRTGISTYRIKIIRLSQRSADSLYRRLEKIQPDRIEREDLLAVVFSALMKGKMPVKERVKKGFFYLEASNRMVGDEERRKMQAMLYMLAVKLLPREDLAGIKEEISMTALGQMLMDDGMKKGIEEGMKKGIQEGMRKGENLFAELMDRLFADSRTEEARLAAKDLAARQKLYQEYGLVAEK